jgi:uncharacterized membrane protein
MIHFDYSEAGKRIKADMDWLRMRDAETARSIISVIASGILSLTVFSFSMVMIILNQAASQMSNRVLDKLIGNRYQQFVLGFYIGTIVYSLFLLTSIRDIDEGIYVPSLSTYLLIVFAVVDIFLFIYFLHYITQSVKYVVIIRRIARQTLDAVKKSCRLQKEPEVIDVIQGKSLPAKQTGIFGSFNKDGLLALAEKEDGIISFLFPLGSYILEGTPFLKVHVKDKIVTDKLCEALFDGIFMQEETSIDSNFYYGFRQLTEVALKALSPGVNDPGTAVESLRSLTRLLLYRLQHHPDNVLRDKHGKARIITREYSFEEMFQMTVIPIWDYGKNDRFIQNELLHLLRQLQLRESHPAINKLLLRVQQDAAKMEV